MNMDYHECPKIRKLQHFFFGLFKILKMVGINAAELDITPEWRIHPVINVSRFKLKLPASTLLATCSHY